MRNFAKYIKESDQTWMQGRFTHYPGLEAQGKGFFGGEIETPDEFLDVVSKTIEDPVQGKIFSKLLDNQMISLEPAANEGKYHLFFFEKLIGTYGLSFNDAKHAALDIDKYFLEEFDPRTLPPHIKKMLHLK